jgi:coatomer subunit beta
VRPHVLADGTYATQAAVPEVPGGGKSSKTESVVVTLRSLIVGGDTYLGAVVCVTLVKLLLRLAAPGIADPVSQKTLQKRKAECMLVMVSMLRMSEQGSSGSLLGLDRDSHDRIVTCLHMLKSPSEEVAKLWMTAYRAAYSASLEEQRTRAADEADAKAAENASQPDDPIDFAHLKHRRGVSQVQLTCSPD